MFRRVHVRSKPEQTEWGLRAVIRDPDGRTVELYDSLSNPQTPVFVTIVSTTENQTTNGDDVGSPVKGMNDGTPTPVYAIWHCGNLFPPVLVTLSPFVIHRRHG